VFQTSPFLLAYVFATFVVGISCIGAAIVLARLRNDDFARLFLWFYLPLSVSVLAALLFTLLDVEAALSSPARPTLQYLESFVGRYGVMLALPLVVQRVFGVRSRRRDATIIAIVLTLLVVQHVTEFVLGGTVWDARGDVAEDIAFAGIAVYTVFVAVRWRKQGGYPPFARRFLVLLLAGAPVMVFDVFVVDGPGLRLYPLWYGAVGLVLVLTLVGRYSDIVGVAPRTWALSDRETDVLRLVQRGLSNQEIARELTISPNTVKTHLSSIFDKSGFRTRTALIAQQRHHPIG
jgi:DNA-binding CsgD family transcriptional regulator